MATSSQSIDVSQSAVGTARDAPDASLWLVSRNFDALAVLGGALAVSFLLYTCARTGPALAIAGALFAMLTDMPHVIQTTLRIGLDPRERALHGRRYVISFFVIALITTLLFAADQRPAVAMVWIIWQFFHVVKQHNGIVRIYAAKSGYRGPMQLMLFVLVFGCVSPVLYRVGEGMRFNEYFVLGQRMPFSGLGLPELPIPRVLIAASYAVFACASLLFVREQLGRRGRGEQTLPWIAQLTILIAVLSYNLSYLLVSDLYALIMIAAAVHSLQYHAISWRRNHGRFADVEARGSAREQIEARGSAREQNINGGQERPTLLQVLSRRENVLGYAALSIFVGATIASTETLWLGLIPFVVVLHHFYMDGFVWRSSLNPTLASDLGIPRRSLNGAR